MNTQIYHIINLIISNLFSITIYKGQLIEVPYPLCPKNCCKKSLFASPILTEGAILWEVINLLGWVFATLVEPVSQSSIEEIYLKYRRLMYATAGKFTQNEEDQKDIVQTAMERLIKIFSDPKAKKRCISAGYIVFTIRSVSIDFFRKQNREAEHCISIEDDRLAEIAIDTDSIDNFLLRSDSDKRLWDLWSKLSAEDRILLEGKHILDFSDEELASILKCKTASVRMKLTRARRRAMKLLSERD